MIRLRRRFCRAKLLPLLVGLALAGNARADDTDIYLTTPDTDHGAPLVMFSIDWRPNLTATWCNAGGCDASVVQLYSDGYLDKDPDAEKIEHFDIYRAVLKKVFEPLQGVKVGLMLAHDHVDANTNGGFIASGFELLQTGDANGAKAGFDDLLGRLGARRPSGSLTHTYQGSELFFEFFRYLTGGPVNNGHNGEQSFDIGGSPSNRRGNNNMNLDAEHQAYMEEGEDPTVGHPFMWDTAIEDGSDNYISPFVDTSTACAKVFTVNFAFGTLNQDSDSDAAIRAGYGSDGMNLPNLPNNTNDRFMAILQRLRELDLADSTLGTPERDGNQSVKSYFVVPAANNTENSFAAAGGTVAAIELSDDVDELVETLQGIFNEILSISTTFVSASIPVNVFNRSQVLDNVYLALFQPMENPRWPGNVKKLKLTADNGGNIFIVDANNNPAVASDGRIKYDALTFWTDGPSLPFPDDNIAGQETEYVVTGKDGRFVPRGGAGQRIPGISGSGVAEPELLNSATGARQLFTQPDTGTTLMALNADTTTAEALCEDMGFGAGCDADSDIVDEAECLLKYARGYDVPDPTSCPDISLNTRSWLFGDPLHSQPLPVNFGGASSNPDIRLIVGGNDGFLRMIRNTDGSANESGVEVWAFMPREVMPLLARLAVNNPGAPVHPYGVDGPPTVYIFDNNRNGTIETGNPENDKVWVFFGLRRGGRAYYGLDISDPDNPSFLWSIDQSDADFSQLGLTFSRPRVALSKWGSNTVAKPVVIFAGGYDPDKDLRPGPGTNDDEGNALFIVDAETGALVWKAVQSGTAGSTVYINASLNDSIPSEVTVYDYDGGGTVDRLYVGDTGGVVWRVDLQGTNRLSWTMLPVLSVGRHSTSGVDRRFFHRPDLTISSDSSGNFDAVIIGSGDRAYPLDTSIANELYMFKDRNTASGSPPVSVTDHDVLADLTDNCLQDEDVTCSATPDLTNGWRLTLEAGGEKSLATPLTLGGTVFFTTYLPPGAVSNQCAPPEGNGAFYAVRLQDATAALNRSTDSDNDGGGDLQKEDRIVVLESGGIPAEIVAIPGAGDSLNAAGGLPILRPDLTAEKTTYKQFWKTFWHQNTD